MAKPAWQPQPAPPAQSVPGVATGQNGRPPGSGIVPMPNAGQVQAQRPPANTPTPIPHSFKAPSPVAPDVNPYGWSYNPITNEWLGPMRG